MQEYFIRGLLPFRDYFMPSGDGTMDIAATPGRILLKIDNPGVK